ncbi:hypothetical protein FMM05_18010 [Flavobacterium zepuense]|uniref:Uncharacterized protein n=1 Tax=Flavobacterium zepuense TaxID=2593302 RepID=A0A552UW26_9FLAO|nr:hypothetical protein [Flavobacterium zepuense]TRW22398.1 hypothetical protein FMM05_18010 [Flavobacterium zepuense]
MDQEYYKTFYNRIIERNHEKLFPYREFESPIFCNLTGLMNENFTCLMFDNFIASITVSNHILERMIKLTLIYNKSLHADKATSIAAYNQYQGKPLGKNIEACRNLNIISKQEYDHLKQIVNDVMRNGFSHSEFEKVIGDIPYVTKGYQGSFHSREIKEVEIDRRHFVSLSQMMMHDFAKQNAFEYYKYLRYLLSELEKRLLEKTKMD